MENIGAKLYELIKADFDKLSADDPLLKSIAERIRKGTASMEDVSQYAVRLGFRLSQAIRQNLSSEDLPNGRMYYNIAEKILDPMLHESYDLVNLTAAQVQELVDTAAGIHIRPQQADFPAERVQKAISAAAEPDIDWEKVIRRMTVPAANITASFADDFMETNAAFRAKAGFMTYIVRKDHSGCCGWCARQAGKYEYSSTPRDVYRRHDNCTCTVTYHADGKRQQVWSKQYWSDEQEQEYLKALDEKKAEKRKALAERKEKSEKSKPKRLSKKEAAERQARVLDKSGESGIIHSIGSDDEKQYKSLSYEPKVTKEVRQKFEEELVKAEEKYGKISTVKGVYVLNDASSDEGNYNDNSLFISLRHAEKKRALQEMARIANVKNKKGMWSSANPLHVIRHEIGHAIQLERRMNDPNWAEKLNRILAIYLKAINNEDEYSLPSIYSGKSVYEFISECIAAGYMKKQSKTVREVCKILNEGVIL